MISLSNRQHGGLDRARVGVARAFTLVELLVAIGAVTLLALGIAQVFALTGQTVAQGRRLSNSLAYASALERQLRADLAQLSHEGFMVVRNELAKGPGNAGIRLTAGDEKARFRRVDELMFFAKGNFRTAREARHPARTASSTEARVYYGHGLKEDPISQRNLYLLSNNDNGQAVDDGLSGSTGQPRVRPYFGAVGPNQYAASWTLARQVTLLARPAIGDSGPLSPPPASGSSLAGVAAARLADSPRQIALQPAAMSIFRWLAANTDPSLFPGTPLRPASRPLTSSGLVDLAATDLSEIQALVLGGPRINSFTPPVNNTADTNTLLNPFVGGDQLENNQNLPASTNRSGLRSRVRMQEWMLNALPADSDGREAIGAGVALYDTTPSINRATRLRVEDSPPNLLGLPDPSTQKDFQRGDQAMLTSAAFLPRCSEFIVEWSFGDTDTTANSPTTGRMVWHGLQRLVDLNGNGSADADDYFILPYPNVDQPSGSTVARPARFAYRTNDGGTAYQTVDERLINLVDASDRPRNARTDNPVYSFFGYVDPMYAPALPEPFPANFPSTYTDAQGRTYSSGAAYNAEVLLYDAKPPATGSGLPVTYDPDQGDILRDPATVPWLWPQFIRITVTLADPTDGLTERTFQIVLPLPRPGAS